MNNERKAFEKENRFACSSERAEEGAGKVPKDCLGRANSLSGEGDETGDILHRAKMPGGDDAASEDAVCGLWRQGVGEGRIEFAVKKRGRGI